jgi:hypothetical protein
MSQITKSIKKRSKAEPTVKFESANNLKCESKSLDTLPSNDVFVNGIIPKPVAQIMDKTINMDLYTHYDCQQKSCRTKSWMFKKENKIYILSYTFGSLYISHSDKSKNGYINIDEWYIKNTELRYSERIFNINDWIKDHIKYVQEYTETHKNINNLVTTLSQTILGPLSFQNMTTSGWTIRDYEKTLVLQITIDNFDVNNIQVNFKNKTKNFKPEQLIKFIKTNSKLIEKEKLAIKQQYDAIRLKQEMQKLQISKNETELPAINMLRTYGVQSEEMIARRLKNSYKFHIPRSLKERYETQACKPLPSKEEWMKEI